MFGFGEDKKEPTERVKELASQGNDEKSIISQMKNEGYKEDEINQGLNKALKFEVSQEPKKSSQSPQQPSQQNYSQNYQFIPPSPDEIQKERTGGQRPQQDSGSTPQIETQETSQQPYSGEDEISLEELVEEIINEKWKDISEKMKSYDKNIGKIENQISNIEKRMDKLETKEDKERERLGKKIEESGTHIQNIEGRISGIEKAFKEFLPQLTDNVKDLSEIVNKMKKENKK